MYFENEIGVDASQARHKLEFREEKMCISGTSVHVFDIDVQMNEEPMINLAKPMEKEVVVDVQVAIVDDVPLRMSQKDL